MSQQAQENVVVPRGHVYAVMAYARSAGDPGRIGRRCLSELQRWLDAPVSPVPTPSEMDELAALKSRMATIMKGECECCVLTRAACADAIAEIEIGRRNAAPVSPDSDLLKEAVGHITRLCDWIEHEVGAELPYVEGEQDARADLDKLVEQLQRMAEAKQTSYGSMRVAQMAIDEIVRLRASARRDAEEIERLRAKLDRYEGERISDVSDEEAGRMIKAFWATVEQWSGEEWNDEKAQRLGLMNMGLMQAMAMAAQSNAETFTYTANGVTHKGEPIGDWTVTIARAAHTGEG